MFRHHEQANLQVYLLYFELSFQCSVIKYKIAFNVSVIVSIIHKTSLVIVTVQELRMFVMLLYCI